MGVWCFKICMISLGLCRYEVDWSGWSCRYPLSVSRVSGVGKETKWIDGCLGYGRYLTVVSVCGLRCVGDGF